MHLHVCMRVCVGVVAVVCVIVCACPGDTPYYMHHPGILWVVCACFLLLYTLSQAPLSSSYSMLQIRQLRGRSQIFFLEMNANYSRRGISRIENSLRNHEALGFERGQPRRWCEDEEQYLQQLERAREEDMRKHASAAEKHLVSLAAKELEIETFMDQAKQRNSHIRQKKRIREKVHKEILAW